MLDPLKYYHLEDYLYDVVRPRFHAEGSIGAFDLFSIVIWKANRSKSKIADRLRQKVHDLEQAARKLSAGLRDATSGKARLLLLKREWGFQLPMASAILSVPWPEEFTVYDVRVCGELARLREEWGTFKKLANMTNDGRLWTEYQKYVEAVRSAVPNCSELKDKDRYLWGRSLATQLEQDLQSGFARKAGKFQRSSANAEERTLLRHARASHRRLVEGEW